MWESLNTGGKIGLAAAALATLVAVAAAVVSAFADPGDLTDIIAGTAVVIIFVLIVAGVAFFVFKNISGPMSRQRKLQRTGLPAEATVLELGETGITVNNVYPVIKLVLEVRPPGGRPCQAEVQTVIGRMDIPRLQPGAVVSVKYDPKDPSNVALTEKPETEADGRDADLPSQVD